MRLHAVTNASPQTLGTSRSVANLGLALGLLSLCSCLEPQFAGSQDADGLDVGQDAHSRDDSGLASCSVDPDWIEHTSSLAPTRPIGADKFGAELVFLDDETLLIFSEGENAIYLATRAEHAWEISDRLPVESAPEERGVTAWGSASRFFLGQRAPNEGRITQFDRVDQQEWAAGPVLVPNDYRRSQFGSSGGIIDDLLVTTSIEAGVINTFRSEGSEWIELEHQDETSGFLVASVTSGDVLHVYNSRLTVGNSPGLSAYRFSEGRWTLLDSTPDTIDLELGNSWIQLIAGDGWVGWGSHDGAVAQFVEFVDGAYYDEVVVPYPPDVARDPKIAREGDLIAVANSLGFGAGLPGAGVVEFRRLVDGEAQELQVLTAPDATEGHGFGLDVSIRLPYIAVSSANARAAGVASGIVDVFRMGGCEDGGHGAECEYRCDDGVANGSETAVDFGGPCVCSE